MQPPSVSSAGLAGHRTNSVICVIMLVCFVLQWVWVLYCDLMCLNYDGSLIDACVTALIAALKNGELSTLQRNLYSINQFIDV